MPLTFLLLQNIAKRALGGATAESDLSHKQIVNAAGRELYQLHRWHMRARNPVKLSLSANVPYVDMPLDFGPIDSYRMNGLTIDFTFTTMAEIAQKRDHAITPVGFHTWGALVQPAPESMLQPLPPWRLEIYPTPTSAQADVLQLWYRAIWPELTIDTEYAQVKQYQESLLISLVQAYAEGWIEDETPYPSERINKIVASRIFKSAVKEDNVQPDVGVLRNGAVMSQRRGNIGHLPYTAPTIT